jgi:hypothetical protein
MDGGNIFSDAPPAGEIKVGRDPLRSIRLRLHYVCVVLCVCFAQAGGRRRRGLMMSVTAYAQCGISHRAITLSTRRDCSLGGTTRAAN